jgi:hypothetical protein
MAFLRINGFDLSTMIEDFNVTDASIEAFDRTVGMTLDGVTYAQKKEYTLTTNYMSASVAFAVENIVRGNTMLWTWNGETTATYSQASLESATMISSSQASVATLALFGTYSMTMGAALTTHTAQFATSFGKEGDFTFATWCRAYNSGTYQFMAFTKRGSSTMAWIAGASVSTLNNLLISAASGSATFTLLGSQPSAFSQAAVQFGPVFISPFSYPNELFLSMASPYFACPTTGFVRPPFVLVSGEMLQTNNNVVNLSSEYGGIAFKGFVETIESRPVRINGAFLYNARRLKIKLIER